MLHISNPIIKPKAGLLNFAEEFGYVSMGLKVVGVSRDMFYRHHELVDDGGIDNLIIKSRRARKAKNRVDETIEQAVIAMPLNSQSMTSKELVTNCAK